MDKQKIGNAIAYLRKRAGYTQRDLADRIGISDKAVSKWERGLGMPDISYWEKLSVLLGTDTDSLLAGNVIHHDLDWAGLMVLPENKNGISAGTLVYDKPLIYYQLGYFMLLGIKQIFVSCAEKDRVMIEKEFGTGEAVGISLVYCGTESNSLREKLKEHTEFRNLMVTYGRTFLYGVDQTRFFHKAMARKESVVVMALPRKAEQETGTHQSVNFDGQRKVVGMNDAERVHTQYAYVQMPFWFCPREKLWKLEAEGESFFASAGSRRRNAMYTEVLDRGFVEMPMETQDQILDVSGFVRLVQKACGMRIYCIEEIAWRRGLIGLEQLQKLGEAKQDTSYGEYILDLCRQYANK